MSLSCGDALIDFVPVGATDGGDAHLPTVGDSCLYVAVVMSRLEIPTGFVGGTSADMFGAMVADHLVATQCFPLTKRRRYSFAS